MWGWLGQNSGQVQIVIAILAFILAYIVYRKVLEQIKISNRQTEISNNQISIANEQRKFELQLTLVSMLYEHLVKTSKLKNRAEILLKNYETYIKSLYEKEDSTPVVEKLEGVKKCLGTLIKSLSDVGAYYKKISDSIVADESITILIMQDMLIEITEKVSRIDRIEGSISSIEESYKNTIIKAN